jgi:hypothetical protein
MKNKLFLRDGKWFDQESGLEVVNPTVAGFFKNENDWLLDSPICDVRPIQDGVLYPWDGGWEVEDQFKVNDNWFSFKNNPHIDLIDAQDLADAGRTRKALRLLPKSPEGLAFVNDDDWEVPKSPVSVPTPEHMLLGYSCKKKSLGVTHGNKNALQTYAKRFSKQKIFTHVIV